MKLYIVNEFSILNTHQGEKLELLEDTHFILSENDSSAKISVIDKIKKRDSWAKEEDMKYDLEYNIVLSIIEAPNEINGYTLSFQNKEEQSEDLKKASFIHCKELMDKSMSTEEQEELFRRIFSNN